MFICDEIQYFNYVTDMAIKKKKKQIDVAIINVEGALIYI